MYLNHEPAGRFEKKNTFQLQREVMKENYFVEIYQEFIYYLFDLMRFFCQKYEK